MAALRIVHGADFHLGMTRYGVETGGRNSRLEDFARSLREFAGFAVESEAAFAVLAGDTFDQRRPGPFELRALAESVKVLTDGGVHVVIGPGNHDGMSTIGDPASHTLAWMAAIDLPMVHVFPAPRVQLLESQRGACVFSVLPYAHKRSLESSAALKERTETASQYLEHVIETVGSEARTLAARHRVPSVFVGHLSVLGASIGSEGGMQMGWDTTVGEHVFRDFDYSALGHLHVQQAVTPSAWYAGAPDLHDIGDAGRVPGWLLATVWSGGADVEQRVNPVARPLVKVVLHEDASGWPEPPAPPEGAIVSLELHPLRKATAQAVSRLIREQRRAGASWVKAEVVVPPRLARARVEMSPEEDVLSATARWMESSGIDPEPHLVLAREILSE